MNMIKYGLPDVVEESLFGCRQSEVVANESITRRRRLVLATLNDDWVRLWNGIVCQSIQEFRDRLRGAQQNDKMCPGDQRATMLKESR